MKNALYICDPDVRIAQLVAVGLSKELQKHGAWNIHVLRHDAPVEELKFLLRNIAPDALVLNDPGQQIAKHLEEWSGPLIIASNVGWMSKPAPTILPHEEAIGAMAADYLLAQKFEHFALVDHTRPEPTPRADQFCRTIKQRRKALSTYYIQEQGISDHAFGLRMDMQKFVEWLKQLPKPCAIFAHSDQAGAHTIRTCVRNGIRVPDEVSVLGVDDDPLYCQTVMPNLASIHLPYARMGTEAAQMILKGSPARLLEIQPATVVERASCRPPRPADPLVDQALDYLRTEVAKGVRVRDLQKLTGLTPFKLVERFHIATGRPPMEMILIQRIETAKRLLAETTETVAEIARQSGFNNTNQFYTTFRNRTGISPTDYRNQLAS